MPNIMNGSLRGVVYEESTSKYSSSTEGRPVYEIRLDRSKEKSMLEGITEDDSEK